MPEKKRKAISQNDERPSKKSQTSSAVKVIHVKGPDVAKPVIANSPGISIPSNLTFKAYSKRTRAGTSDILLHSSDHPTIDYTATEARFSTSSEKYLKHYVAVYDPSTNELQITEAKKMTVRSCVRERKTTPDPDQDENEPVAISNYTSRAALTQEFGTRKSKRVVQSIAENRLLRGPGTDKDNPLADAIISTLGDGDDEDDEEGEGGRGDARVNKPLPRVDMAAEQVEDLYPLTSLVFPNPPESTLAAMPWRPWCDRISAGKEVKTTLRFVANRVGYLAKYHLEAKSDSAKQKSKRHLELLRYLQVLFEISKHISKGHPRQQISPPNKWPAKTISDYLPEGPYGTLNNFILSKIVRQFFPENTPTQHCKTLLNSTILALTLQIPPPSMHTGGNVLATEPTDISLDLALDRTETNKLYRELGCTLETAREHDLTVWGLQSKTGGLKKKMADGKTVQNPKFAMLRVPPVFPLISQGRPMTRRR